MMGAMSRIFVILSGVLGFSAVALGAFGAHGLAETLKLNGSRAVAAWDTAAQYQMYAALAVIAAGLVAPHLQCKGTTIAAALLTLGAVLFSGSLYVWSVTQVRGLMIATPIGGLLMILGFTALAWTCFACCGGERKEGSGP